MVVNVLRSRTAQDGCQHEDEHDGSGPSASPSVGTLLYRTAHLLAEEVIVGHPPAQYLSPRPGDHERACPTAGQDTRLRHDRAVVLAA